MKYKNDFNWNCQDGNVYIEYLAIASLVLVATLAFFKAHLDNPRAGVLGDLERNFVPVCKQVAGTNDC